MVKGEMEESSNSKYIFYVPAIVNRDHLAIRLFSFQATQGLEGSSRWSQKKYQEAKIEATNDTASNG